MTEYLSILMSKRKKPWHKWSKVHQNPNAHYAQKKYILLCDVYALFKILNRMKILGDNKNTRNFMFKYVLNDN